MKLENRTQLTLLREQCQEKRNKETCKILVCGGTGCLAGGSDKIFDRFSELTAGMDHVEVRIGAEIAHGEHVGVKKSGCHGFCEMGPLVRIEPYNYLYLKVKLEDCEEIFEKSVLHGEPVTRLMYKQDNEVYQTQEEIPFYAKQTRLVLKNCGHIDAEHIEDALAVGAYEAFEKAVFEMTPEAVIKTITQSNLRGRGGAGFQTGRKWSQVAGQKEKIRYVVCNGDEGDPGDRGQPGFFLALPFFRDLSKAARRVSCGLPQRNALTAAQFSASHRRVAKIRHVKRLSVTDHGFMRQQSGHRVSGRQPCIDGGHLFKICCRTKIIHQQLVAGHMSV